MKSVDDINHEAQIDLRECVKELSCLYNIVHLASHKDIAGTKWGMNQYMKMDRLEEAVTENMQA